MIRKLVEPDRTAARTLLMQAPAMNLYMLGNMATLGFDATMSEFWGDWAADGALRALLNRYMHGWACFGSAAADWAAVGQVVDTHPITAERLQDNPGGIPSLVPYLHAYRPVQVHVEELMDLSAGTFRPQPIPAHVSVRRATPADLDALVDFYADAAHMTRRPAAVARPLRDTRIWIGVVDGAVVTAALTNAETAELAMIGGVYTPPAYRARGLSQAACSALCAELLSIGKRPVLYWETPAAGAVYRKLGFRRVGEWRSVWLSAQATLA